MQTWFTGKVKYNKTFESGSEAVVTEQFLFDAVSYTDAETRITQQMQQMVRGGEFTIDTITKPRIADVFPDGDGQWWWKATINLVTIDEEAGKEKKIKLVYLIMADDLKQALTRLEESLEYMISPYSVSALAVSPIVDVFPSNTEDA